MNLNKENKLIHKFIRKHKNIFIMGHMDLDLDAIGACVGFYEIVSRSKRNPYIVINEKDHEAGVKKVLNSIKKDFNIIDGKTVRTMVTSKDLLVIVDANKNNILQDNELLDYFREVVVIDHHEKNESSIIPTLEIINYNASSTCEMLTKYMYYYDIKISPDIATVLLSGIVLDTNYFAIKTNYITYYCAYYLAKLGADNRKVQYLLKQDINDYILRQRVITDVEVINKKIAFAVGSQKIKYKREELAKIADTLLNFDHIEMSFVIGKLDDDIIGISARSIGKENVGDILSLLGGGGGKHEAATKIENKSLKEVEKSLKDILEGDR